MSSKGMVTEEDGSAGRRAEADEGGRSMQWTGRVLSGLVVAFMLFDAAGKLAREQHVVAAQAQLGFPDAQIQLLGVLALAAAVLYAIPRTAVFGAVFLTAYLGGATAAKVRLQEASLWFSVAMGVLAWLGLWLRDARLRALVPWRRLAARE
ncbi:MAG TPA: DoxX family protein [Myxococcales bacterium]|nr:DoxX family protein [Myxococcales bacterium]